MNGAQPNPTQEQVQAESQPKIISSQIIQAPPKVINWGKILFWTLIPVVIIGIGIGIYYWQQNKQVAENLARVQKDQTIVDNIFLLRNRALDYYEKNKSYKDWQAPDWVKDTIRNNGSLAVIYKPTFQSFIIYAALTNESQTFFCVDNNGFAAKTKQKPTENQAGCQ